MFIVVEDMPPTIVYREKYGINGHSSVYVRNPKGDSTIVQLSDGLTTPPRRSIFSTLVNFFIEVFLPQGYPESVRDDYCRYQIWDTVQAFCSTISGILTTHAIMKSVGVGDATATALSATITWVLKDGIGMIGRIVFAWWKGHALDTDSKKWRLFADILNDAAMFLELLLLPVFPRHPTQVLCLTTSMKGIVGVAGGAARASITQHHALRGNNGDVSAKDGSQETCVNLLASTVGMALLSYTENNTWIWVLFCCVTVIHLAANYLAVKALALVTFNGERLNLYLHRYLETGLSYSPATVNQWESPFVFITYTDRQLCGFRVRLGHSVQHLVAAGHVRSEELVVLSDVFSRRPYLCVVSARSRTVYVLLSPAAQTRDVLQAYLHSVLTAAAVCLLRNIPLAILKGPRRNNVISRVAEAVKGITMPTSGSDACPLEALAVVDDIIDKEFLNFYEGIRSQGWSVNSHSLEVDEWRGKWGISGASDTSKNK